jgi:hypothetical protein
MQSVMETGVPTAVIGTTSGSGTIGAGNPCNLLGIFVGGALTAQVVQLWTQTAGGVIGTPIVGTCTLAANAYYRIPGVFSKGITYWLSNENTSLTFFWVPAK